MTTAGLYDNAGLPTWNGLPLSAINHPSSFEDALSATWTFYVDPATRNQMYIVASDVRDTNFGFINGTPFSLAALTGFSFSLELSVGVSAPAFSDSNAVPGEFLLGPVSGSSAALTTTPGWSLSSITGLPDHPTLTFGTPDVSHAFTHFSSVFGTTRIFGGGVLSLIYSPTVDLLTDADFSSLSATAYNGFGAYVEPGTLASAYVPPIIVPPIGIPEPTSWAMMILGLVGAGISVRRARGLVALRAC